VLTTGVTLGPIAIERLRVLLQPIEILVYRGRCLIGITTMEVASFSLTALDHPRDDADLGLYPISIMPCTSLRIIWLLSDLGPQESG